MTTSVAPQRRLRLPPSGAIIAIGLIAALALISILVPMLTSETPAQIFLGRTLLPPVLLGGSWAHPLGTDDLGRDVLLQLANALRVSALVAAVSVLLAGLIGAVLGLLSGYRGGWIDFVVSRITEAQLALPLLVIAMTLIIALGPSLPTLVVAIALNGWVPFARLVRAETLVLRDREFVILAQLAAVSHGRIILRHLVPNVIPSALVLATQQMAVAVIEESSLSFLGLGVQPPQTSLGLMVGQWRIHMQSSPWLPLAPVIALAILAFAVNLLGDTLRNMMERRR